MTSWDDWCCPHPECDEGRTYSDPDTVFASCCDRGHEVRLTWHGGEVQARLHYRGRRLVRGPYRARSLRGRCSEIYFTKYEAEACCRECDE